MFSDYDLMKKIFRFSDPSRGFLPLVWYEQKNHDGENRRRSPRENKEMKKLRILSIGDSGNNREIFR